jgi:hypothetical protein
MQSFGRVVVATEFKIIKDCREMNIRKSEIEMLL